MEKEETTEIQAVVLYRPAAGGWGWGADRPAAAAVVGRGGGGEADLLLLLQLQRGRGGSRSTCCCYCREGWGRGSRPTIAGGEQIDLLLINEDKDQVDKSLKLN
ncbi:tRNA-2-methylthio-N(6)-dimethylallyladenosine synthase [Bienertia sinuspersici]